MPNKFDRMSLPINHCCPFDNRKQTVETGIADSFYIQSFVEVENYFVMQTCFKNSSSECSCFGHHFLD